MTHTLKILPEYFNAVLAGRKTFEFRYNDRDFKVGDKVILQEFLPTNHYNSKHANTYTGAEIQARITYVLPLNLFIEDSKYCIFSIKIFAHKQSDNTE